MMIPKFRNLLILLTVYMVLLIAGLLVLDHVDTLLSPARYATLLSLMTAVTIGAYLLVAIGAGQDPERRGMLLIAAIGGKFLAYLILILIFWAPGKNLSKDFIITFFVLYLVLTFFLIGILYKTLKSN